MTGFPEAIGRQEAPETCAAEEEVDSTSDQLHPDRAHGELASGTEAHHAAVAAAVEEIITRDAELLRRLGDA